MNTNIKIYPETSATARMADIRVYVKLDHAPTHPTKFFDLVFKKLEWKETWENYEYPVKEVDKEKCSDYDQRAREFKIWHSDGSYDVYYTTPDRIKEMFNETWTNDDLKKIEDEEKKLIDEYENGAVFIITVEKWSPVQRMFVPTDDIGSMNEAYGLDDCIAQIEDLIGSDPDHSKAVPVVSRDAEIYFIDYLTKN